MTTPRQAGIAAGRALKRRLSCLAANLAMAGGLQRMWDLCGAWDVGQSAWEPNLDGEEAP